MKCKYQIVCPFQKRKIRCDDATFASANAKYCEGDSSACAIFTVIDEASFLAVPADLLPSQNARVYQVLANSIYA